MCCAKRVLGAAVGILTAAASPAAPVPAPALSAQQPLEADAVYEGLQSIVFDASAALRVAGVELTHGPATLVLEDGTWIPLAPVAGQVTGGAFIGAGRLRYQPPSGVEQQQLEKFTDEQSLTEEFERLYLRFSDGTAEAIAAVAPAVTDSEPIRTEVLVQAADSGTLAEAESLRQEVERHFREQERIDRDSRLLGALLEGDGGFFDAWIDTRSEGPLHFAQDAEADDLFMLRGWSTQYRTFDVWGGLGGRRRAPARPLHYVIDMTLDGDDLEAARVELTLEARRAARVLRFEAHPVLDFQRVLDTAGEPLFFARSAAQDDEFEGNLTVVLPEPLAAGEQTTLLFEYDGEIVDTVWGGGEYALRTSLGWYPSIGYLQRATYDLTFRVDDGDAIFAAGERIADEVIDGVRVARFEQKLPVAFVSFNYGSMPTRTVEVEGAPPITVFGSASGLGGDALGNVGADVGNSLVYFSQMFGNYPFTYMSATRIPYSHGQGFPGLLHLAAGSFGGERRGHTEAFRGHETAHQWWGHMVGWASYRDQWISEGFAMYSGALYAEAYLGDPQILDEMTAAWRNDAFKRGNAGYQSFGMAAGLMQRRSDGTWSGPITLGYRLAASETPADYAMLAYEKGAYVLHMLRMAMYDWSTGSDEPWRAMMRDFVARHIGGEATTESFRAVVEQHFGEDMGWFFDQWVYGTAVPTYRWAWQVADNADGQRVLRLRVRQQVEPDVPFRMFVPVRVELDGDRFVVLNVLVDEPEEEFSFDLPEGLEPEAVVFNPRNTVLAEVDEESW